jgi:subtilisin family serine protease
MRRQFAELPDLVRYLLIALAILLLWWFLRWLDKDDELTKHDTRTTPIHYKLRAGFVTSDPALFSHRTVDDRARWHRIDVPRGQAKSLLAWLAIDPRVEEAFVPPTITLATVMPQPRQHADACPITTPSFETYQGYVGPAPGGIDAPAAWRLGVRGQGVWFADIEGGWNDKHEDLPGDRISHVHGRRIDDAMWRAHGTAVLGEVVGRDNGKGVVGIAPDVERVFTSSLGNTTVADAIDAAAEAMRPGDVLLIELQGAGPRGRYLPVEYWDDNYDAIAAATKRGVIVIEAAGNGG